MKTSTILANLTTQKVIAGAITALVAGTAVWQGNNLYGELDQARQTGLALKEQIDTAQKDLDTVKTSSERLTSELQASQTNKDQLSKQLEVALAQKLDAEKKVSLSASDIPPFKELALGQVFEHDGVSPGQNIGVIIDDGDLDKLKDSSVEFDGEQYDYHEQVELTAPTVCFNTHPDCVKEYADVLRMQARDKGWLTYKFIFDDTFDRSKVSDDEPLELPFLGQNLRIVGADNNSVTVQAGKELFLKAGEEKEGVKLLAVFDNAVSVEVAGKQKFVKEGRTEEFGAVSVYLDSAYSSETREYAKLFVGSAGKETFGDGENFYLYGGDKSLADHKAPFVWDITQSSIGVRHNLEYYDEDALKLGQKVTLPAGFLSVSVQPDNKPSEVELEFSLDDVKIAGNRTNVLLLESSDGNGFKWTGDTGDTIVWDGTSFRVLNEDTDDYDVITGLSLKESGYAITGLGNKVSFADLEIGANLTSEEFSEVKLSGQSLEDTDEASLSEKGLRLPRIGDLEDLKRLKVSVPKEAPEVKLVVQ